MIVPISKSAGDSTFAPMPSETNLLMAVATMHNLGKFNKSTKKPAEPGVPPTTVVGGED